MCVCVRGRDGCSLVIQRFQHILHFFGHHSKRELKLTLVLDHAEALITQKLQRGGQIDLFGSFGDLVQYHVDQNICASSTYTVTRNNKQYKYLLTSRIDESYLQ